MRIMSNNVVRSMAGLILLVFLTRTLAAAEKPLYAVYRTQAPIVVDGKLDDAFWERAPAVGPFVNNNDGSSSALQTEAKLAYDDEYLYFAFKSHDDNIWSTHTVRDAHLWKEEVVEVFLKADPNQSSYIELEVNPLGTMLDIFLLDIRKPLRYESWNSHGMQWAVEVHGSVDGEPGDDFWTCEIALPLADVIPAPRIPPEPGDRWLLNLYRVENRPARAGLAWAPTMKPDFHVPDMFGEIEFSAQALP